MLPRTSAVQEVQQPLLPASWLSGLGDPPTLQTGGCLSKEGSQMFGRSRRRSRATHPNVERGLLNSLLALRSAHW